MNTSSYICESTSEITTPRISNFIRGKQAWENAIANFQGADALDNWYNFILWYENYRLDDPEQKFRHCLERCLRIFEHIDFYKQDLRMLRLWIKYIEMQPQQLNFYQELYHRNIGRTRAEFYAKWGAHYETFHAWKEAETVYNLGMQEDAQPYSILQNSLAKLEYNRAMIEQELLNQHEQQQQQQQQQQHKIAQDQQQQASSYEHMQNIQQFEIEHHQQQQQHSNHIMQSQQQLEYEQKQHLIIHQNNIHQTENNHINQQQQEQQNHEQLSQQCQQSLGASTTTASAYHTVHIQEQQQQQQHNHNYQTTNENHQHQLQPHNPNNNEHLHQHPQQQQYHIPTQNHISTEVHDQYHAHHNDPHFTSNDYHQQDGAAGEQYCQEDQNVSYYQENVEIVQECPRQVEQFITTEIPKFIYTENFVNYTCVPQFTKPTRNLEEPYSINKYNHYAKDKVYPPNVDYEYSPEELLVRKRYPQYASTNDIGNNTVKYVDIPATSNTANNAPIVISEKSESSSTSSNKEDIYGFSEHEDSADDNDDDNDDNDNDNDEDYGDEDEDENSNSDSDYDEPIYVKENVKQVIPYNNNNNNNLPIKIKLKKEHSSNDANSGNGSYKITSICQPEILYSPKTTNKTISTTTTPTIHRNGNSFHPYYESTPKTSSSVSGSGCGGGGGGVRRHKGKIKKFNTENEYPNIYNINSNSSTIERPTTSCVVIDNTTLSAANDNAVENANFNDNANFSFSSAVTLDNSNCSISSAVGRLNFKDTSGLGAAYFNHSTITTKTNALDISTYQDNSYFATQYDTEAKELRLNNALKTIERHLSKQIIDPFNSELCHAFLTKIDFPGREFKDNDNYKIIQTPLPKIANTKVLNLGDGIIFNIDREVGRGSYGSVYKATDANNGTIKALKYTKPANTWEIYICDQVLKRIKSPMVRPGFMDISTVIISPNASLIATEFSPYGSLLDINNKLRQATTKVMHESLVMHFSAQICNIVHHLHKQKIIHADIKPDNFLLMRVPRTDLSYPTVRLIDFGCAIDMSLFPNENTKFRKVIQTDGFTCIEMQEGRPWSYETDLYCVAGTIHVMLFGEYMHAQKRAGAWDIKQKLPRYFKKHVWTKFFNELLNINSNKLPNLEEMVQIFEDESSRMDSELQKQMRTLSNILHKR